MLINTTTLNSLYVAFNKAFQDGVRMVAEPQYQRIVMDVPSTTRANEYGWFKKLPKIREWIGDRVIHSIETDGFKIVNRSFEDTIGVDRDDISDDNVGVYTPLFSELGGVTATFPDEQVWPHLAAGWDNPCYDGQPFFDTDHPVIDERGREVSVSNDGGGNGTPWFLLDVSRAVRPIVWQKRQPFDLVRMDKSDDQNVFMRKEFLYGVDGRFGCGYGLWQLAYGSKQTLDADSYEAARAAMREMKGDNGRPLGLRPTLLVVPPSLEGAAREILMNERNANGATNKWKGTADLMDVSWLA